MEAILGCHDLYVITENHFENVFDGITAVAKGKVVFVKRPLFSSYWNKLVLVFPLTISIELGVSVGEKFA